MNRSAWQIPALFQWLQKLGHVAEPEMFNVFNMGIGLVLAVPATVADKVLAACSAPEYPAFRLGEVRSQTDEEPTVVML